MYLTYSEYTAYEGTTPALTELQFNQCEFEAEGVLNWYTMDRLIDDTTYSESVKRCMYALVKYVAKKLFLMDLDNISGEVSITGTITSQSNDGVSTTYDAISPFNVAELCDNEVKRIMKYNLRTATNTAGRKLLYRGYYPGE